MRIEDDVLVTSTASDVPNVPNEPRTVRMDLQIDRILDMMREQGLSGSDFEREGSSSDQEGS